MAQLVDLEKADRLLDLNQARSAKGLLRRLLQRKRGFKMTFEQACCQTDSQKLIELELAVWENGKLVANPEYFH